MHRLVYQALWLTFLSEAHLQAGRWEAAAPLTEQALALARTQQESGTEAWALRLCGELAARRMPPAGASAEVWYRQARALADALGMRPLLAHCHFGLGTLYSKMGQREQARTELSTAIELYRVIGMTFWLPQAEMVLAQVKEQS
jgi:tetratricopeptide (TPR) repeat protein